MAIEHDTYLRAGQFIEDWSRVLPLTHERPDGDALGCLVALTRLLTSAGKQPSAFLFGNANRRFNRLLRLAPMRPWVETNPSDVAEQYDGLIIADTCTISQLTPVADLLKNKPIPVLALDHHVSRDYLADHYLIDESASSASLIVQEWAQALDWQIDEQTAEALFVGIATDTGWFRFSNTDARTLLTASRLLQLGVPPDELAQEIYSSFPEARLRLIGRMLTEMELHAAGQLAIATVTQEMLRDCHASQEDTQDLVNEPQRQGSVNVSVLLVENKAGPVKVSLRSKRQVNVAVVAEKWGGGGHERAAGVRIEGSIENVKKTILEALLKQLKSVS